MLSILRTITIIIALMIALDHVSSFLFTKLIFNHTYSGESGGTINYAIKNARDLDFLVLGASRAKHGIDPNLLTSLGDRGYNLGINATDAVNAYLIADILLRHSIRPRVIILQSDLFAYTGDSRDQTLDQIKRLYPYDTPLIRTYVKGLGLTEEIKYMFGLYHLNRKIINISYNFLKPVKPSNGFVGLPDLPEPFDMPPKPPKEKYVYHPESLNVEAVAALAELLHDEHIRLVVVFPPTYGNLGYEETEQKKLVEDLASKGVNTVIDMSNVEDTPSLVPKTLWRDAFHFNAEGAHVFSELLNDRLKKLAI